MENEQIENEQDVKIKVGPATFYFYNCSVPKSGDRMMKSLASYAAKSGQDGSEVLLTDDDIDGYRVQMQSLQIEGNLMYGIMRRLRRDNRTIIGSINRSQERLIPIKKDEYFIEKTHFLYHNEREVLLYQQNQAGVPPKIFSDYVSSLIKSPISFGNVWTQEGYEKLMRGDINLQEFKIVRIASPTNTGLYQEKDVGFDASALDMMNKVGGQTLELTLGANIKRAGAAKKNKYLNKTGIQLVKDYVKKMHRSEGSVEATFYDSESGSRTYNFVEDKFQFKMSSSQVEYVMTEGKLDSSKFFEVMKNGMEEAQPELRKILKKVND